MAEVAVGELAAAPLLPPPRRTRRPSTGLSAAATAVALLASSPLVYLVVRGLGDGPAAVLHALASARLPELLLRTLLLAGAVTVSAVALALPLAWLTVRTDLPARRFFVVATALPLVIPSYVGAFAFVAAVGPRGALQRLLEPLGVDRLPEIYGFPGAWLVLTLFTYPLVLLPARAALRGLDPSLEEAARSLGRNPREVFFSVTLPQLRPAVVSGALLVALYTLADFGAVSLLRFHSFTRAIYIAMQTFDRVAAAALGLVLVVLMLTILWAEGRTRGRVISYGGRTKRASAVVPLRAWRWAAVMLCVLLLIVAIGIPVGVTAYWLVRALATDATAAVVFGAAGRSLRASAVAAAAAVVCAWPVALIATRHRGRLATWTERAAHTGYSLPGLVAAIALVFFGIRVAPFLYQTLAMLVIAYVVLFLPQAIVALRASLIQVPPAVEEAARSLGSAPFDVFRRVTMPLVRPGLATGAALVFLTAMKELPATLLLAPIGFSTLATEVWDATSAARYAQAAAPALALVALSSLPLAVLLLRERRR